MTAQRELGQIPGDLYGKHAHEPALSLMTMVAPRLPSMAGLVVRATHVKSEPVVDRQLVVCERTLVACEDDVVSLVLEATDQSTLPRWWPGAHIELHLSSGLVRHYSLCGTPADRYHYRIAVRRVPGGVGSAEIHQTLLPGARVKIRGPRNAFPLAITKPTTHSRPTRSQHFRFAAGGIGITPILPMLHCCNERQLDWSLIYTGRSRQSMAFLDELERFGDRVTVRSDDIDGIPLASQIVGDLQNGDALYCCGPSTMIQAATAELSSHPQVQFHYERFGRAPIVGGNVFDIELSRTGQVLRVPANQSVLDIVRQARPNVPYSCQQGFCGTCRTRLLAGEIEHNNHPPAPWHHDDEVLICVSRSSGERLVLDL